jgi:hypothetical protein
MRRFATNVRALPAILAAGTLGTMASVARAADGFEKAAPHIEGPLVHWPALGMTLLFAVLIAVAGFKDSRRSHLD